MRSRTIREGSVGLLTILGLLVFGGLVVWLRNLEFGERSYKVTIVFPDVNGIQPGAPVNYRGYKVGEITDIQPGSDGVDVAVELSPTTLSIPQNVEILANSTGLIGETSIDITPQGNVPPQITSSSPVSSECNTKLIICANERIQGQPGPQLVPTLARLSNLYGNEEFFNNINSAAESTAVAATEIAVLSQELGTLSTNLRLQLKSFSGAADSLSATADQTSRLVGNVDNLVTENRTNLTTALTNVNEATKNFGGTSARLNVLLEDTSQELTDLIASLEGTATQINSKLDTVDTDQLVQNLETLTANAAQVSQNLNQLSTTINDPTNLVVLQQTLDSARVTFENTQKITSDLDELTGDPNFRDNVRELVNGLSGLVSSTQQLQQELQAPQLMPEQNASHLGAATSQVISTKPQVPQPRPPQLKKQAKITKLQAVQPRPPQLKKQAKSSPRFASGVASQTKRKTSQ